MFHSATRKWADAGRLAAGYLLEGCFARFGWTETGCLVVEEQMISRQTLTPKICRQHYSEMNFQAAVVLNERPLLIQTRSAQELAVPAPSPLRLRVYSWVPISVELSQDGRIRG